MIMSAEKHKVLVIDDELGPRESLRILLKKDYEVLCAPSVEKGLQMLKEHDPDVVVMDIRMPGMSGIDGLREVRAIDPHIAVIMLTGFGSLETAQEALRLGANDYLKKPFDTREMQDIIRQNVQRTQINRKRAHTERELQELNHRLVNELVKKDRMASLGQASAELVHDLRNPLAVVLGYVQLLGEDLRKSKETWGGQLQSVAEYIEIIEKSVRRCRDLVEVWRNLGKKDVRNVQPASMAELCRQVVREEEKLAREKGAGIVLDSQGANCQVLGDPVQLSRTLHNIISNAIDALPEQNGLIQVTCRCGNNEVKLTIRDNGQGIAPENLARVFEPQFTTKTGGKGTGLGLFITRKIIEDHQGRIDIQSEPGKGTTVTVTLPAWEDPRQAS